MDSDVKHTLRNRFVLFGCEGTAGGVVIQRFYDGGLLLTSPDGGCDRCGLPGSPLYVNV